MKLFNNIGKRKVKITQDILDIIEQKNDRLSFLGLIEGPITKENDTMKRSKLKKIKNIISESIWPESDYKKSKDGSHLLAWVIQEDQKGMPKNCQESLIMHGGGLEAPTSKEAIEFYEITQKDLLARKMKALKKIKIIKQK